MLDALVELTEGHGYDGDLTALVREQLEADSSVWSWNATAVLATLLERQGRVDEALAAVDDLAAHCGGMWIELLFERVEVLARSGRVEQAIAELRAHHEGGTWYGSSKLADLLVLAGRPGEAIRTLESIDGSAWTAARLAVLLVDQGRVEEALALFAPDEAPADDEDRAFWRQFHRKGRVAGGEPTRTIDRRT
ncbi:hypothetical protein ACQEVZ_53920 [Dactylosporangium sp. CA-152071]|uniref:hypothetical protein n=1 Tax=Dactylosporangium sp. CA-152071 TaxID=3239933 RepID=UPI003D9123AA